MSGGERVGPGGARLSSARRSPDDFFVAAYGLLGEVGHTGLTVAALCARLEVSKGSFYHHFDDMPSFVGRFGARWSAWADRLFTHLVARPDPLRQLEFAANEAFVIMSPGAQRMRAWAHSNPTIADALASPERIWWPAVIETFADAAQDQDSGRIIATMNYAASMGFLSRPECLQRERYVRLLELLFRSFGVHSDVLRPGGRPRLQVVSWDRGRARSIGFADPLPQAEVSAGPAAMTVRLGPRGAGSAQDEFFLAALELLAQHGAGAVTVAGLVGKLNVSTGCFQHHFGSMARFVTQFAAHRERAESRQIKGFLRERNPWLTMELLHAQLLIDPDPADTAWRAWGHTDQIVGAAIRRMDQLRQHALAETISRLVEIPDSATAADLTLGFAIGLHQGSQPLGPAVRGRAAVEWMRRIVGIDAEVRTDTGAPRLTFRPA